jgi:hypothetical protein
VSDPILALKIEKSDFSLRLSEITAQRLSQDLEKDQLSHLLGYDRPEEEQPEIPIEDIIESLSGIVLKAAAIAQSGANEKKADLLVALRRIEANPEKLFSDPRPSEQVIGRIAIHYQRDNETPGHFWWDISEGGAAFDRIEEAAKQAADELEGEKNIKSTNLSFAYLTLALRIVYRSFGFKITRVFDPMKEGFVPEGKFSEFAQLVCNDWIAWVAANKFPVPISTDSMAKRAVDKKWVQTQSLKFPEFRRRKRHSIQSKEET